MVSSLKTCSVLTGSPIVSTLYQREWTLMVSSLGRWGVLSGTLRAFPLDVDGVLSRMQRASHLVINGFPLGRWGYPPLNAEGVPLGRWQYPYLDDEDVSLGCWGCSHSNADGVLFGRWRKWLYSVAEGVSLEHWGCSHRDASWRCAHRGFICAPIVSSSPCKMADQRFGRLLWMKKKIF